MSISRRHLLRAAGAAALASPLAAPFLVPGLASGRVQGKRLVVVFVYGGWDVTYAIDPKLGLATIDGPDLDESGDDPNDREALRTFGGTVITENLVKRPAVSSFFETWGARTAVVNGIWVGSIAHDVNAQRMLTGSRLTGGPDLAAISGYALGASAPIPYLALGGTSFVGDLAAYSGRSGEVNQLRLLVDPSIRYDAPPEFPFEVYPQAVPTASDRDRVEAYLQARGAAYRAERGTSGRGATRMDAFDESLTRSRDLLAEGPELADTLVYGRGGSLTERVEAAVRFLQGGVSHTISLDSGLSWDTHTDNTPQHASHEALFAGLSHLMTRLEEAALLDDTVVWVVSEMTRTPKRNASGGKDHWNTTSALVIGDGVRGGTTLGATDDRLEARPVDLATGALWDGGDVLRYDQFAAGVLSMLDVDPGDWLPGVPPFGGLRA